MVRWWNIVSWRTMNTSKIERTNEPPVPRYFINHTSISPRKEGTDGRSILVQHFSVTNSTILGGSDIPKNVMVFHHRSSYVPHDHNNLIYVAAPWPDTLVVRIVTLDKWVIGVLLVKVPLVHSRPTSKRLHLNKRHTLVTRWEASNERLVDVNIICDHILRRRPFTCSPAEISTEATLCRRI